MADFDKAFQETPSAFSQGVSNHLRALQEMEEKPVKRKSFSVVLIAALVIMTLAATALAVANRAGLLDFFSSWKEQDIPQTPTEFTQVLNGEAPLLREEFDDFIVTVTEAAGDGRTYYFNTTIELKPGVSGHLVGLDRPGSDGIDAAINANDGLPVYFVRDYIYHGEAICDSGDRMQNADGSISSVSVIDLVEASDVARMGSYITYVKSESGVMPDETATHTTMIPFEIPILPPVDARKLTNTVSFEELGITLDELYFKKMEYATYCFTYLQYEGGAQVGYRLPYGRNGLTLRVLNEDGLILIPRLACGWASGTYFSGYNYSDYSMRNMEDLPGRVVLEVIDENSETVYGSATVDLVSGELETDKLAAYNERPETMLDQRDMYFPWSDMSFDVEYAYLSTDDGGIPVYLDPRDPSTVVGNYYSGLKVAPNITFDGWSSIYYFGDDYNTSIKGYVRSESVVAEADAATPGIPIAQLNEQTGESIDVHVRPSETSTVWARVDGQDRLLVIGEMDGWYQIAREEGGFMRVIGYVPAEALTLTEERVSMR